MDGRRNSLEHVLALVESSEALSQSVVPREDSFQLQVTHTNKPQTRKKRRQFHSFQPCQRPFLHPAFPLHTQSLDIPQRFQVAASVPALQHFLEVSRQDKKTPISRPSSHATLFRPMSQSELCRLKVRETLVGSRRGLTRVSRWFPLVRRRTRVLITKCTFTQMESKGDVKRMETGVFRS